MGLDQYLHAKDLISRYSDEDKFNELVSQFNANEMISNADYTNVQISFGVGYWRKANQIHEWFVKHVQDGEDNCAEYYVNREDLEQLLSDCNEVLADKSKAYELLPPASGFFFGGTEIDDYYFEQVEYTAKLLTKLLDDKYADYEFYYSSSW